MTTAECKAPAVLLPGDSVRLPSGVRGRFVRWSVPLARAMQSGRERVALVQLEGDVSETSFSAAYAARFEKVTS
ncbi:MAG: hypothetical protein ABS43_01695 [Bordetella sp. SCN 67-23]|nr:MAG: hypothetical protein ABS43_01695 [Bordetella sp. SCN 67-23]OJW90088.1 MAG: hypothetical protein BGO71_27630 [Burkholderiales bacterium 67-32]